MSRPLLRTRPAVIVLAISVYFFGTAIGLAMRGYHRSALVTGAIAALAAFTALTCLARREIER